MRRSRYSHNTRLTVVMPGATEYVGPRLQEALARQRWQLTKVF